MIHNRFPMLLCISILPIMTAGLSADIYVGFDQDEYVVSSVDEVFAVNLLIDADPNTDEPNPLPEELFSFGTRMTFDATKAEIDQPTSVTLPNELDHFGFANGGFVEITAGSVGGKGNVDQTANPLVNYSDVELMSIQVTNKAAPTDSYLLELELFRTLGPTEQLFVDGSGAVRDEEIVFGTARVRVVPEPTGTAGSLISVFLGIYGLRRRKVVR